MLEPRNSAWLAQLWIIQGYFTNEAFLDRQWNRVDTQHHEDTSDPILPKNMFFMSNPFLSYVQNVQKLSQKFYFELNALGKV